MASTQAPGQCPYSSDEFPPAVKDALSAAGIPLRAVAEKLAAAGFYIAPATLSEWGKGVSLPPRDGYTLDRLLALERALDADRGRLVAAYYRTAPGPWDIRRRARRPVVPATSESAPAILKAELEARGCTNEGTMVLTDAAEHHRVGDTRRPMGSDVSYRVLALRPDARRYWVTYAADEKALTTIVPGPGCSLGAEETAEGSGYCVQAVELRLDRPLDVGDTGRFAFSVEMRPPDPDPRILPPTGWFRVVTDPACRRLCLDLSFALGERPAWVRQLMWEKDTLDRLDSAGTPVHSRDGHFRWELTDPRPAAFGYRWEWPGVRDVAAPAWAAAR